MARIVDTTNTNVISLDKFIETAEEHLNFENEENFSSAAANLRALSNDKTLISNAAASALKAQLEKRPLARSVGQSLMLGRGRGFYIRLNFWPVMDTRQPGRSPEAKVFSYLNTHDHNFEFMTIGCLGPGYSTDIYRIDRANIIGKIGEKVPLEFVETVQLIPGRAIHFRAMSDAHTQYPPQSLSASVNLIIDNSKYIAQDQYCFDHTRRTISELPQVATVYLRASIVSLASSLVSSSDAELVSDLVKLSPCRRVRAAAIDGLGRSSALPDEQKVRILESAASDSDEIVRTRAKAALRMAQSRP